MVRCQATINEGPEGGIDLGESSRAREPVLFENAPLVFGGRPSSSVWDSQPDGVAEQDTVGRHQTTVRVVWDA